MSDLPAELARALGDLPVFPLPDVALFPGALLPLHIFEPRYRAMLAACLTSNRAMVIARLDPRAQEDPPRFARVGGLGVVVEHQGLPDGRSNIVLRGQVRVALEEIPSADPFRHVRATVLEQTGADVPDSTHLALLSAATAFAARLGERAGIEVTLPPGLPAAGLVDLCAQHLIFDPDERQAALEELDVGARITRVATALALQEHALDPRARSTLQ